MSISLMMAHNECNANALINLSQFFGKSTVTQHKVLAQIELSLMELISSGK
jgi:hypothetical protein